MTRPTAAPRPTTARLALFTLAATLTLSACGNKGPLVLPDKPNPDSTAAPAATTPAIDETASPLPPSSPPPAADPVLNQTDDDGNGR